MVTTRHDPSVYEGYYLQELTHRMSGDGRTLAVVGHGFIGGRVARAALAARLEGALAGPATAARARAGPGHEILVGDARHRDELAGLLEGADHVVFAAGTAKPAESNEHPMHEIAANLGPLLATLEGMRRASVPRVHAAVVRRDRLRARRADADPRDRAAVADQHLRRAQGRRRALRRPLRPAARH